MNCKSITISGALVAVLAIAPAQVNISSEAISLDATAAFANNGNGNGNGGGNGNAGGNGNGRGNGNAGGGNAAAGGNAGGGNAAGGNVAGRGNAGTSGGGGNRGSSEGASNNFAAEGPRTNSHGKLIGKDRANFARTMSREFKGLNAYRASASAYANANRTTSQVGLIAAYDEARKALDTTEKAIEQSIKDLADAYNLDTAVIEALLAAEDLDAAIASELTTLSADEQAALKAQLETIAALQESLVDLTAAKNDAYAAAAKQDQDVQDALDQQLDLRIDR